MQLASVFWLPNVSTAASGMTRSEGYEHEQANSCGCGRCAYFTGWNFSTPRPMAYPNHSHQTGMDSHLSSCGCILRNPGPACRRRFWQSYRGDLAMAISGKHVAVCHQSAGAFVNEQRLGGMDASGI